jgi:hypothetical protein
MSTLTVELPEEDLQFLRQWTKSQGTSAEAFLAKQAQVLRESSLKTLHPHVVAATGIFPSDLDIREAYLDAMEEKHR